MKFFDKWFYKKSQQAWENKISHEQSEKYHPLGTMAGSSDYPDRTFHTQANRMNIVMYKANGGMVVETQCSDRQKDECKSTLHIITDDKNLGEELGKIITYESLKL
jgi:hypothetical protein